MTNTMFLTLLSCFSAVSALITGGIKNIVTNRADLPYNVVALVTALIVGGGGTAIYYQLNTIPFTVNNIIYMMLMGLASGLCSMVGFDKFKQMVLQITHKKE